MRKTLHVVSLLSLSLCFPNQLPAQSGTDPFKQQLEPMIEQVMKQQEVPGFAIAIVRDQKIVYVAGFGVRSIDNKNDKITPRSLFHMASITKPFVATSVMQLVEQGKIVGSLRGTWAADIPSESRNTSTGMAKWLRRISMPKSLRASWD